MRKSIIMYINGKRHELNEGQAFMTVAEYLRYEKGLTGTKVVCAEGDCGACTILVSRMVNNKLTPYKAINSCIGYMHLMDRCHIITVEGLKKDDQLHPVQKAMVDHHGAQCGYCTPGFICAMASLTEDAKLEQKPLEEKRVKNYLTGNLCRCTGYDSIVQAGCSVDLKEVPALGALYDDKKIEQELAAVKGAVLIRSQDKEVYIPVTMDAAVKAKRKENKLKLTAGATDLGVLSNKGKANFSKFMTLHNVPSMYEVKEDSDSLIFGSRVTLDIVEKATERLFPEFSRKLHIFASPQIKNSATLVGNVINASPIGDSIPFLRVAEAELVIRSADNERVVNINQFYKGGYKELDLAPDEVVTHIKIPKTDQDFRLFKVSLRKDLDISAVTMAIRYKITDGIITNFSLAVGGVGPTVLRMTTLEQMAQGQSFERPLFQKLAEELKSLVKPLSDVRGSAEYRRLLCHNLLMKFCDEVLK